VSITGKVHGSSGSEAAHKVRCAFTPRGRDAALAGLGKPAADALPEEERGLLATLVMAVDVCQADEESSVAGRAREAINLAQRYRTGELSLYKGYRHVYHGLPPPPQWTEELISKVEEEELPESFSLLASNPGCFPDRGREVVQDQGLCGSCWALAAASALMTNICVHGNTKDSLASETDRFEISSQRLMSCNPWGYGCDGGHAMAASDSFIKAHMSKDRDVPYLCGGGSALEHFEKGSDSCTSFPWGGSDETCKADKANHDWHYGGIFEVTGEEKMAAAIVSGAALYVTFAVYEDLFWYIGGVYRSNQATLVGAHAGVALGFGVMKGEKYWYIQNSWGVAWGLEGYFKFLKGENHIGVEDTGIYLMGWPVNTDEPAQIGGTVNKGVLEIVTNLMDEHGVALGSSLAGIGALSCLICWWFSCCCSGSPPPLAMASDVLLEESPLKAEPTFDFVEDAEPEPSEDRFCCCTGSKRRPPARSTMPAPATYYDDYEGE